MVEEGKFVAVHYTGSFDNGDAFDTSIDSDPLEFQVGSGSLIPGFENAVIGMKIDDEKDIVLMPEEAYGVYDESLIYGFPLADVKSQFEPEIGMTIGMQLENGQQVPAVVSEITDDEVKFDLNHPLAGKTLHFHIKVVDINDEAKYGGGGCGGGCNSGCCDPGCSC